MDNCDLLKFEIIDDSGYLALIDASAYEAFLGDDWDFRSLKRHIEIQSEQERILFWNCGDGGNTYKVDVSFELSERTGFKLIESRLLAKTGALHLVSYSALTMAAQFEDEKLPANHEMDLKINLSKQSCGVRVIQHYDPDDFDINLEERTLFTIEIGK